MSHSEGSADVAIIRWPTEANRRDHCRALGVPRLLVLEGRVAPPVSVDVLEDWVRPPLTPEDFEARTGVLRARAKLSKQFVFDTDNVLQFRGSSIQLSPSEARLMRQLGAVPGQVVSHGALVEACWPGEPATRRNALNLHILRLRRRVIPLRLEISTVWGRGYLLEVPVDAPRHWSRRPMGA